MIDIEYTSFTTGSGDMVKEEQNVKNKTRQNRGFCCEIMSFRNDKQSKLWLPKLYLIDDNINTY